MAEDSDQRAYSPSTNLVRFLEAYETPEETESPPARISERLVNPDPWENGKRGKPTLFDLSFSGPYRMMGKG